MASKKLLLQTTASIGLLFCALAPAMAQDRDRDRGRDDGGFYTSRDDFYRGERWRAHLFQRVRDDLDYVQSRTFPVSRDEFRIVRTKQELGELQDKLANGRYDERELDDVVSALQRVVDSNKLSHRDRDILSDDLSRIREYREHHEDWVRR